MRRRRQLHGLLADDEITAWRGMVVSTVGEPSSDMWPPVDVRRSAALLLPNPPDVLLRGSPAAPGPMSDGRQFTSLCFSVLSWALPILER